MAKIPLTVVRSRQALLAAVRNLRSEGQTIGFVPTMGALHSGHLSLVAEANARADATIVSIFVNPKQFAPGEDFDTYPRNEEADLAALDAMGCAIVYLPRVEELYPAGSVTDVRVPGLSDVLDGVYRPHFFYGVTTVVARLFLHVSPDLAVFGEKDFQQLQIIRRMTTDLGFPIDIVGAKTQRDLDGLAQSSRNLYLSERDRGKAGGLIRALVRAKSRILTGTPIESAAAEAKASLQAAGFTQVDYISAVDSRTLAPLEGRPENWPAHTRMLGAAWLGDTRLIDNIQLT